MCIAVSGRVIQIDGDTAKVDISGNVCAVNTKLVEVQAGDHVMVHAGYAIEVLKPHEARQISELFEEIAEAARGDA